MTPKEKAKELIDKFAEANGNSFFAKECALIAVNEILNNNNKIPGNVDGLHTNENSNYWQQVKQEIKSI